VTFEYGDNKQDMMQGQRGYWEEGEEVQGDRKSGVRNTGL